MEDFKFMRRWTAKPQEWEKNIKINDKKTFSFEFCVYSACELTKEMNDNISVFKGEGKKKKAQSLISSSERWVIKSFSFLVNASSMSRRKSKTFNYEQKISNFKAPLRTKKAAKIRQHVLWDKILSVAFQKEKCLPWDFLFILHLRLSSSVLDTLFDKALCFTMLIYWCWDSFLMLPELLLLRRTFNGKFWLLSDEGWNGKKNILKISHKVQANIIQTTCPFCRWIEKRLCWKSIEKWKKGEGNPFYFVATEGWWS